MKKVSAMRNAFFFIALLFFSQSLFAVSSESESNLIQQAQVLLKQQQPEQAYQLMAKGEFEFAGSYRYDYVLGMSALAAGRYSEATIAFERVLVVKPGHIGAMLDMGLAYFKLGNRDQAIKQFEQVLASNPPQNFRVLADEALKQARSKRAGTINLTRDFSGYLAFSLGYDSNINSATENDVINAFFNGVPIILTLSPGSLETEDYFARLSGGFKYQLPVSANTQWVVGGIGSTLMPFEETENQNLDMQLNVAYQVFKNNQRWTIGANTGYVWLDQDDYLQQQGVFAGWRSIINEGNLIDLAGYWKQYRYEQTGLSVNDFDQGFVAARLIHRVPGKSLIASAGLIAGMENSVNGRADGDSLFYSANVGLQGDSRFADVSYISFSLKQTNYDNQNVLFNIKREDTQLDLTAGMTWELENALSLTGEVRISDVNSNIDIYSYDRIVTALTLRKDFD